MAPSAPAAAVAAAAARSAEPDDDTDNDAPEPSPFVEHPREHDDGDDGDDGDGGNGNGGGDGGSNDGRFVADDGGFLGTAKPFLVLALALSAGALLGLVLPADARHLPDPRWARASNALGWAAFAVWTTSFWPQILSNRRRKSARGLSPDFVALNVLGFACYSAFCALLYWNGAVAEEFARRTGGASPVGAAVQLNDVAFAFHAFAAASITACQCVAYDRPRRALSAATRAGLLAAVGVVGAHLLAAQAASDAAEAVAGRARRACGGGGSDPPFAVAAPAPSFWGGGGGADPPAPFAAVSFGGGGGADPPPLPADEDPFSTAPPPPWTLLDVAYTLSAVKMVVTLTKYLPQAAYNFRRRSTAGWSVTNILLDFSGGLCSLAQQILGAIWWRDLRSVITANPVRFALSVVSLAFDLLFVVQHYVLFRGAAAAAARGNKRRRAGGRAGGVASSEVEDGGEAGGEDGQERRWLLLPGDGEGRAAAANGLA